MKLILLAALALSACASAKVDMRDPKRCETKYAPEMLRVREAHFKWPNVDAAKVLRTEILAAQPVDFDTWDIIEHAVYFAERTKSLGLEEARLKYIAECRQRLTPFKVKP